MSSENITNQLEFCFPGKYHCHQNGMSFRQGGKLVVNSDDMTTDQ